MTEKTPEEKAARKLMLEERLAIKVQYRKEVSSMVEALRHKLSGCGGQPIRYRQPQDEAFLLSVIEMYQRNEQDKDMYNRWCENYHKKQDEVSGIMKALAHEQRKNQILQHEIEDAKTSSGLFIDFVRKGLGLDKGGK
tara:strand:- start:7 stop:420 length:414 start_codon:yes stop_codon:yes gene_type:complete